jgi:hypothetical protein
MHLFLISLLGETTRMAFWSTILRLKTPPTSWLWIGIMWAIAILSDVPVLYGAHENIWIWLIAAWLFLWLIFFDIERRWKRLWGKLKSQALTAVNAARFEQQVKESF